MITTRTERLRIGATPWSPTRYAERVADVLLELGEPEGAVELEMSSELLHSLRHGDLDLALVHLPVMYPDIESRALGRYRFCVLRDPSADGFDKPELRLEDLAGRTVLSWPSNLQPAPMLALRDRLLESGVVAVNEMDLRDMLTMAARLRKTGEVMLGSQTQDSPLFRITDTSNLIATPVAEGEIDFTVGIAWRAQDSLNLKRILGVVNRLRQESNPLDWII